MQILNLTSILGLLGQHLSMALSISSTRTAALVLGPRDRDLLSHFGPSTPSLGSSTHEPSILDVHTSLVAAEFG